MFYLLILQLLWIAVSSSHSISKLQIDNRSSDVYEIREDKDSNTIAFANPKSDHQPLREIVYYHLIERPNGEPPRVVEGPVFDDTTRPFTNSHGFPFLEPVEKESALDEERNDSSLQQELETDHNQSPQGTPLQGEEVIYYDEEEAFKPENDEEEKQEPHALEGSEEEIFEEANNGSNDEENTEPPMITDYPVTTPVVELAVEKKAKRARKLLFDLVKERYYSKNNTQNSTSAPLERRKRDINMAIPEAPKLGPINYDSLPPYVRAMISTEKPVFQSRSSFDSSNEDLDEIRRKMEVMMEEIKGEEREHSDKSDESEVKPRTFGMNLTEDHGYVWNNMWSKPGMHFNVEASESIEDNQNANPDVKEELEMHEESTESINKESYENTHDLKKPEEDDEFLENSKEIEEPTHDDDKRENDEIAPVDEVVEDENTAEDKFRRRKDKKKETTISDLLEDDQFWKWLADWTSVYMDVISENVKELVEEEVSKQIKNHENAHKDDEELSNCDDEKESSDKEAECIGNKESSSEVEKTNERDDDKTYKDQNKHENDDNTSNDVESLKRRKDKEDKKKPNHNENDTNEDQQKDTSKIQAHNLFGNSIGSEKVTNIFVFYPNSDTNKLVQEIDSHADTKIETIGSQNVTVDERINVADADKTTEEKDRDTSSEKVDLENEDSSLEQIETDSEHDNKDSSGELNEEDNEHDRKDSSVETLEQDDQINKDITDVKTDDPKESSSTSLEDTQEIEENTSTEKLDAISITEELENSTDSIKKEEEDITDNKEEERGSIEDEKGSTEEEKGSTQEEKGSTEEKEKIEDETIDNQDKSE